MTRSGVFIAAALAIAGCSESVTPATVDREELLVRTCDHGRKIVATGELYWLRTPASIEGYTYDRIAPGVRLDDICRPDIVK